MSLYQIYLSIMKMCYFWLFQIINMEIRVLVQIGTQVIGQLVATMMEKEL